MKTEPTFKTDWERIDHADNLKIEFKGEDWGDGPKDTSVTIQAGKLCFISWADKDDFAQELKAIVDKYAI